MQRYEQIFFSVYNGGGNLSRYNRLFVFFDIYQSKARSGYDVIPVSKAMAWRQKSYGMTSNESFSLRLKMNIRLREISVQLNIRECFFSNTNRTNLTNLLGCDMVYIRGIREITSLWSVGLRQISWSRTSRKR